MKEMDPFRKSSIGKTILFLSILFLGGGAWLLTERNPIGVLFFSLGAAMLFMGGVILHTTGIEIGKLRYEGKPVDSLEDTESHKVL